MHSSVSETISDKRLRLAKQLLLSLKPKKDDFFNESFKEKRQNDNDFNQNFDSNFDQI